MGKKAILFIVIGVILGVGLAGGGVFFMIKNGAIVPEEELNRSMEYDLTQGKRLTLEKVQIPLASSGSKTSYLQADFTIVYKTDEALEKANTMIPDIKSAIYGVFETKTAEELKVKPAGTSENGENTASVSPREAMREPLLDAIRELYLLEEDKENVVSVIISSFMVV